MTNQHPITPPLELLDQWANEYWGEGNYGIANGEMEIATQAARWGADQELEACLLWVGDGRRENLAKVIELRDYRRPKPPSLKEQALKALGPEPLPENSPAGDAYLNHGAIERHRILRRALEALPND